MSTDIRALPDLHRQRPDPDPVHLSVASPTSAWSSKLRYKGIDKFIAYEVDLDAVRAALRALLRDDRPATWRSAEDLRVLDFNGHQIMANFSLQALGEPIKYGS